MPQTPATWLENLVANTTAGEHVQSRVIQLGNGNILVAWGSLAGGNLFEITGRLFDRFGRPVNNEFQLNTASSQVGFGQHGELAATGDGGFLTAYADTDATGTSIRLDRFNATGGHAQSFNIAVDATTGDPTFGAPVVAVSSPTSALVVYERIEGGVRSLVGAVYDQSTSTVGAEFSILASSLGSHSRPAIATLTNGNYVVVSNAASADASIIMRILSPTGGNVKAFTTIGLTGGNGATDQDVSVAPLIGGGFVVSWTRADGSVPGVDIDVVMQVFNAVGNAVSGVLTVDSAGGNDRNQRPDIVALADGTFVVVYESGFLDAFDVSVQRYTAAGVAIGVPHRIDVPLYAGFPSVTALSDGRLAVTFTQSNDASAFNSVVMQILDVRDVVTETPDFFSGTVGNDIIESTALSIGAGAGDDTIRQRVELGNINAGDDDDVVFMGFRVGTTGVVGGAGVDMIDWTGMTTSATQIVFDLEAGTAARTGGLSLMNGFENLIGTGFSDTIRGTSGANELYGMAGNDVIEGRGGADLMFGGDGVDRLLGGDGADILVGNDQIFVALQDTLEGGAGDDLIYGENADVINGGTGFDSLIAINSFNFNLNMAATSIEYAVLDFGDDVVNAEAQTVGVSVFASGGVDNVRGSGFADLLFAGVGNDIIRGGAGNDSLVGEGGADFLDGGEGNDSLYIDRLDTMIDGGAGFDAVYVTPVAGSSQGISLSLATNSIEFVQDLAGFNDTYDARNAPQGVSIFAGGGIDIVMGGSGADTLFGEAGGDNLDGGAGNDVIVGGAGADFMTGGSGNDTMFGGLNDGQQDIFRFAGSAGAQDFDAVHEFVRGEDKLDVSIFTRDLSLITFAVSGGSTIVRVSGFEVCMVVGVTGLTSADLFFPGGANLDPAPGVKDIGSLVQPDGVAEGLTGPTALDPVDMPELTDLAIPVGGGAANWLW